MKERKVRIERVLSAFWRKVFVCRIPGTKLWRVEVPRKAGLGHLECKDCAYAILDALCRDFSITCVVTVV